MPQKDLASGLIQRAKEQESFREKKNWFNSLPEKHRAEISKAAKEVEPAGIPFLSLAKVIKATFKIDRSPAHIARVLKELAAK
jgi:hypothetical protein